MTKQLLFIHGGDSPSTYDEYVRHLSLWKVDNPFKPEPKRWKRDLPLVLGNEWECAFPVMPNKGCAHYKEWHLWFEKLIPFMKDDIVFVGHSLGANFLAQYLATIKLPVRVAQLHLVAGCTSEGDFAIPESLVLLEEQCDQVYIYHSTDDPVVPFSAAEEYAHKLPTAELVTFTDRGHFLGETFPELIARVLK